MRNGYNNGRIAAAIRNTSGPAGPGRPRSPPYAVATYGSYEDFRVALQRDFGVAVGEEYGRKIKGPVRIDTNCCVQLYVDNHEGLYRALVTRQELTEEQARTALMGGRRV